MLSFSLVALALSAIGIYGLLAWTVGRRMHEIAIRMALGSSRKSIMLLILRKATFLLLAGLGFGLAFALAAYNGASAMIGDVGALDGITMLTVATTLLFVSLLASYLPVRRALDADPLLALKSH
jgi:ABC-type antimicrobial peptide transport system permease subunit